MVSMSDSPSHSSKLPWLVETHSGPIQGHVENNTVAFRGIPYAEPPVGPLRFRRAQPVQPWTEVFDARENGSPCPQYRRNRQHPKGMYTGDEDCLWLNVFVPRAAFEGGAGELPVVVYVHGGANIFGSAASPWYSAERIADSLNCVFVIVNWRIGILGQLSWNFGRFADTNAAGEPLESNPGHSDLITAIEWVHANAEAFHGDPNRITMMGQSSGGGHINALYCTPRLQGKHAGVIAQSPAAAMVNTPEETRDWCEFVARWFHRMKAEQHLPFKERTPFSEAPPELSDEELRATTQKLLAAEPSDLAQLANELFRHSFAAPTHLAGPLAPCIDGDLIPKDPRQPGASSGAPLLVGTNENEYQLLIWEPTSTGKQRQRINAYLDLLDGAKDVYKRFYKNGKSRLSMGRFIGDAIFLQPALRMANQHPTGDVWFYRLATKTPFLKFSKIGTTHVLDIAILFEHHEEDRARMALLFGGREALRKTTKVMHKRWKAFIHDQDPGFARFSQHHAVQVFDADLPESEHTFFDANPERREAWSAVRERS